MRARYLYKILFLICFWEVCALFITFYDASILGFRSESWCSYGGGSG